MDSTAQLQTLMGILFPKQIVYYFEIKEKKLYFLTCSFAFLLLYKTLEIFSYFRRAKFK